jgi:hypothetical protein
MHKFFSYGLAVLMMATVMVGAGCGRGYIRSRTHNPGDRSVTIVKRPSYKGVSGRSKAVTSTKYNRKIVN